MFCPELRILTPYWKKLIASVTRGLIAFRSFCAEIEEALAQGETKKLLRAKQEIEHLCEGLAKEYGLGRAEEANLKIGFGPVVMTRAVRMPRSLSSFLFPAKAYLVFLRNIYYDLTRLPRLGAIYDRLFWDVVRH